MFNDYMKMTVMKCEIREAIPNTTLSKHFVKLSNERITEIKQ